MLCTAWEKYHGSGEAPQTKNCHGIRDLTGVSKRGVGERRQLLVIVGETGAESAESVRRPDHHRITDSRSCGPRLKHKAITYLTFTLDVHVDVPKSVYVLSK